MSFIFKNLSNCCKHKYNLSILRYFIIFGGFLLLSPTGRASDISLPPLLWQRVHKFTQQKGCRNPGTGGWFDRSVNPYLNISARVADYNHLISTPPPHIFRSSYSPTQQKGTRTCPRATTDYHLDSETTLFKCKSCFNGSSSRKAAGRTFNEKPSQLGMWTLCFANNLYDRSAGAARCRAWACARPILLL